MNLSYEDNPREILENLLKHHDIKTLRGILNNKVRKKAPRGNNYFKIAVDVYLKQNRNDSKLEWAINEVAESTNISDKTVKNHITKFRTFIKEEIEKLPKEANYSSAHAKDINTFINYYIERVKREIADTYGHLYEPETPYAEYKRLFDNFIFDISMHDSIPF